MVDDAALSSFHVPAVIDRAPLTIAISSGGDAPMLARLLRERLETLLDHSLGALATLAARLRKRIRAAPSRHGRATPLLRAAVLPARSPTCCARAGRRRRRRRPSARWQRPAAAVARQSVVLVGAGPGDPGLLTLRALRALNEADVILHDRLVSAEVLELARRDAERIEVGKQAGHHHTTQDGIHALMLEHARAGRRVVRLKGGDPFVFGRGGEELELLRAHGIPYEVVPGITAAVACAAYAGVPLTHRDHAQSVRFVTAHLQVLARHAGLAGAGAGAADPGGLHGRGRAGCVAAAPDRARPRAVHAVCAGRERLARRSSAWSPARWRNWPQRAAAHAVQSPALLILGEVAALASTLGWFGAAAAGRRRSHIRCRSRRRRAGGAQRPTPPMTCWPPFTAAEHFFPARVHHRRRLSSSGYRSHP